LAFHQPFGFFAHIAAMVSLSDEAMNEEVDGSLPSEAAARQLETHLPFKGDDLQHKCRRMALRSLQNVIRRDMKMVSLKMVVRWKQSKELEKSVGPAQNYATRKADKDAIRSLLIIKKKTRKKEKQFAFKILRNAIIHHVKGVVCNVLASWRLNKNGYVASRKSLAVSKATMLNDGEQTGGKEGIEDAEELKRQLEQERQRAEKSELKAKTALDMLKKVEHEAESRERCLPTVGIRITVRILGQLIWRLSMKTISMVLRKWKSNLQKETCINFTEMRDNYEKVPPHGELLVESSRIIPKPVPFGKVIASMAEILEETDLLLGSDGLFEKVV